MDRSPARPRGGGLVTALVVVGWGLGCSRDPEVAAQGRSSHVQACGVALAGQLLAETSAPGHDGSATAECRFAADESVAELTRRFAAEEPTWRESAGPGEGRVWTATAADESVRVSAAPVTEAVRARHPRAQAEVHVQRTRSGTCPPCGPGVVPPPGCRACS
jgi:hypothetical protein